MLTTYRFFSTVDLEEDFFTRRHAYMSKGSDKNTTLLRSLYYPPLEGDDIKAGIQRCGEHADYVKF